MASHTNDNPWQDVPGHNQYQGQGYQNPDPYSTYQDQTQTSNPYAQDTHQGQYQPPAHPPPHQQPLSSHPPDNQHLSYQDDAGWGEGTPYQPPQPQSQNQSSFQSQPAFPSQHHADEGIPPSLPPRRSATDIALPTGQDRSHQIEVMQSYEAAGRKDEHDQNVETLQREFPKIDGSLIAAIYGDSNSLSATREMLGALE
jgi:hypothetical protein